jgi:hypothetical protein
MTEKIELSVQSESPGLSVDQEKKLMLDIKNEFGDSVSVSIKNEREEPGALYDFTTGLITTIGTVIVTDPNIVEDVIKYLYNSDHISLSDIINSDGQSLIEVSGDINIDVSLIKNEYTINESTKYVEPVSEKKVEKIKEIDENKEQEE